MFTSKFWPRLQNAMGTSLKFSTAFHPQTDGQSERTIQILKNILGSCVFDFKCIWDDHFPLMEFSYNNIYQSTIGMARCETLYGRRCKTPLCWDEVGERKILGPELIDMTTEKIKMIRERIKIAQSRQKFYVDKRKHPLEFQKGDFVFLRISPWKGIM